MVLTEDLLTTNRSCGNDEENNTGPFLHLIRCEEDLRWVAIMWLGTALLLVYSTHLFSMR